MSGKGHVLDIMAELNMPVVFLLKVVVYSLRTQ